ncbi:helix-turn-helix domain-containing protein, partial [Psychrobacter celer]|uniref:helix-turn-helix domain-containing protein n=1 Tax=Psychrobacter celer TaxID=306572 RepID=UPI003FD2170D
MQNKLEMMRIFCVAAESRNFKEAATQLGISPQVVTRAIKDTKEKRDEMRGTVRLTVSSVLGRKLVVPA